MRATDKDGKYAEQLITLNIKNKNDAPVFTTSFETFKSFQTNSLDLNLVSEEERKNLIFIDSKTSLDLNSWVNDIDKVFDINESLTFHLEIMDNEGQVFEINNNNDEKYNWISLSKNILEINATENNIGSHFIRFSASDSSNETITSLFNINVRHKNRAPIINENFLSDDIFNIKGKGILNSTVSNNVIQDDSSYSKVLLVSLEEESEINFKLPKSLFLDPDLLLDENEKLSIKLIGSEELFNNDSKELNVFTFDEDNLSIFGSTIGLAIDKSNGAAIWKNKLIAEDNYGKSTSIDLIFSLQRTALKPSVEILNEINDFEEGNIKTLNEFRNFTS